MSIKVDLPEPVSPITPIISFFLIFILRLLKTKFFLCEKLTFSNSIELNSSNELFESYWNFF